MRWPQHTQRFPGPRTREPGTSTVNPFLTRLLSTITAASVFSMGWSDGRGGRGVWKALSGCPDAP